jgi:hypothetical protein
MAIINSIASWLIKKRIHQIELFRQYPLEVQRETFLKLVKSARDTEWGKQHHYADIRDEKQFRRQVQVHDYETFQPYVERIRKGQQNILWPSEIRWFAKSSGTTSAKSKFIPVSQESLEECHFKGGKDMLTLYLTNFPESQIFTGKSLTLSGSLRNTGELVNGMEGDLSAVILHNLPFLAEFARTPSPDIALMDNWDKKIAKIAEATIQQNVTSLAGVPSWMLLLMHHVLKITGKRNLHEVWPELEVFFHGGVNFSPYQRQFEEIVDTGKMKFLETYNASEGFFGIQDQADKRDLLLMLDYGIYYEFIPNKLFQEGDRNAIGLDEVQLGVDYALVISTNGGLWRYLIGDTIQFTSLHPFRIKIVGRTKHFINAFGEELMIDNTEEAFRIACDKTNARVLDYTGAPVFSDKGNAGAHQYLVEFSQPPKDLIYFSELFDNALKSLNSDYEAKRYHDLILGPPQLVNVPESTFYNWLKKQNKLGGQFKVPRLLNDRKVIDEIISTLA